MILSIYIRAPWFQVVVSGGVNITVIPLYYLLYGVANVAFVSYDGRVFTVCIVK